MPGRLKPLLCEAVAKSGLDSLLGRVTGSLQRPWVVGYHAVVPDRHGMEGLMPGLAITTRTLEQHLSWIGRRFRFASLDELAANTPRRPQRRPLAAITFDDGYRGVYEHAWPILRRMGIPAACFVVVDRIVDGTPLLHDQLFRHLHAQGTVGQSYQLTRSLLHALSQREVAYLIGQLPAPPPLEAELPLSWEMVHALRANGCTIGSHTQSHELLTAASPDALVVQTQGSRTALAEALGAPVDHFAYPDGAFDVAAVAAVAGAGYQTAYTTCSHRDPRHPGLTVPRTMLWEGSSNDEHGAFSAAVLACQSSGLLGLFSSCRVEHGARRA